MREAPTWVKMCLADSGRIPRKCESGVAGGSRSLRFVSSAAAFNLAYARCQALGAQVQGVYVFERGFQFAAAGQGAAFLMHIFFNVCVQSAECLSAPADGVANTLADEVSRHVAYVSCHGRFPVRVQLVQRALELVCQGGVTGNIQPVVGEYTVVTSGQSCEGQGLATDFQCGVFNWLATHLHLIACPVQ